MQTPVPEGDDRDKADAAPALSSKLSIVLDKSTTFAKLGLCAPLAEACKAMGYVHPTMIQKEALPYAFQGRDIIGLAQTGSGKTAAFALPVLQDLLEKQQKLFALVLSPTRELAVQIARQFEALGSVIGVQVAVVVGGIERGLFTAHSCGDFHYLTAPIDTMSQAIQLAKRPHIIVGTPGRVVYHLENTKGFSLRSLQYLVLDEADRLLNLDFEREINTILKVIPKERHTYLFSATMTTKVQKLQRASLRDPVKLEVSTKYTTPATLLQQYLFIPAKFKDVYLVYVLTELSGNSIIVFASTCQSAMRCTAILRNLGFPAVPLHGQMTQPKRLASLNKFASGERKILVATDVASRGLDIPSVDCVINLDTPHNPKDYVHRVGRTARAGHSGRALSIVTQYDIEMFQRIEELIGLKMEAYKAEEEAVLILTERVNEAQRLAAMQLREQGHKRSGKDGDDAGGDDDDAEGSAPKLRRGGGGKGSHRKSNEKAPPPHHTEKKRKHS